MDKIPVYRISPFPSTEEILSIKDKIETEYFCLLNSEYQIELFPHTLERMQRVISESGSVMLYCDYKTIQHGTSTIHPTIDYQTGSLRDDFDFGPLWMLRSSAFQKCTNQLDKSFSFAGLYDLRLALSRTGQISRLPELLYCTEEKDLRSSGEKQFDYVNPRNREVQIEMEKACTRHLQAIGGFLSPVTTGIDLNDCHFKTEASVVIPVRNRVKTITDAIRSVLDQKTDFNYNVIVVDNHSTDGTTESVMSMAKQDDRVVHLIPTSENLGIGGCWNEAILSEHCGKFAVQLDSDDLYNSPDTLQKIIDAFYMQQCAMLVGSYQMVNFKQA